MKAVRIHEYGDVDVLRIEEVPQPVPGPGEVLVRVAATTFNPVDARFRAGAMAAFIPPAFPYTPGMELSGTVVLAGTGVPDHEVGSRVIALLPLPVGGGAAEFAVVSTAFLAPAPATVPLADAAALPVAALTADQALGHLAPGMRVLLNGAGGAVGGMAVRLAKNAGAYVVATASPRSASAVRSLGADEIIDYTATPVPSAVTTPVDLLVNMVAASPAEIGPLARLVADGGRAVSTVPMELAGDESRGIGWETFRVETDVPRLTDLALAVDKGALRLDVSARYPFTEIATVHTAGSAGQFRGKVLLTVEG
ncbi:NADP-dependent oxidoreductase [Actinoplanes sp. TBRC 11911]|uniref:NADP-dependent oxidoreductase n=1 Tax=Actinoplanes sp. TBRC 11911 TaxID=2729386 RepID=UPI00145DA155|nr:NADP-dependent oxidoreductase [Actinoplanes sp. TBRC 11911]NMO50395.1 NADP-dependent oxidoreductase [Actinoplanes sp. TBRC 11911]